MEAQSGSITVEISQRPNPALEPSTQQVRLKGPGLFAARLAWGALLLLCLGLAVSGVGRRYIYLLEQAAQAPETLALVPWLTPQVYAGLFLGFGLILFITLWAAGLILFARNSGRLIPLLMSAMLIVLGTDGLFGHTLPVLFPNMGLAVGVIHALSGGLVMICFFLFPDGRPVPAWRRWSVYAYALFTAFQVVAYGTPLELFNWPAWAQVIWWAGWLGDGIAGQVVRYFRVSTPLQRQQTKWVLLGAVWATAAYLLLISIPLYAPQVEQAPLATLWELTSHVIYVTGLLPLAVALVVSMLRFRLWQVDELIHRSLIYGALSIGLVLLFGLLLALIPRLFEGMALSQSSLVAAAAAGMLFGVGFQPARRRLQNFVDSRIYNIKIDYEPAPQPARRTNSLVFRHERYADLKPIGQGGMGSVYLARQVTLNRKVAIKMLPLHLIDQVEVKARFEREARILASLEHPNIVRIYDYGAVDDLNYIVMEYISGWNLAQVVNDGQPLSLARISQVYGQLGEALDYLHAQNLVHRDIKPSNIMLERTKDAAEQFSRAVLMDFGIAKARNEVTRLTTTGSIMGTMDFLAPEQIQDVEDIDGRADIYALGVVLYLLVTGELPFKASSAAGLLIAHLQQPVPDPRLVRPSLPAAFAEVVFKSMAKDRTHRYNTAGEMALALKSAVQARQDVA